MCVGGRLQVDYNKPAGYDRARNREIGKKDITLETMEEAFTSEHWIVRIFRVSAVKLYVSCCARKTTTWTIVHPCFRRGSSHVRAMFHALASALCKAYGKGSRHQNIGIPVFGAGFIVCRFLCRVLVWDQPKWLIDRRRCFLGAQGPFLCTRGHSSW